jgi:hypothetical protein
MKAMCIRICFGSKMWLAAVQLWLKDQFERSKMAGSSARKQDAPLSGLKQKPNPASLNKDVQPWSLSKKERAPLTSKAHKSLIERFNYPAASNL